MENDNNKNEMSENLPSDDFAKENLPIDNSQNENITNNNSQNKRSKGRSKKKFNIFNPFKNSFKRVKSDEEKKNKSIKFGLFAILFSCICVGLCYPCVWLGVKGVMFAFSHSFGFFTYFLGIGNLLIASFSIGAMVLPYYFWFQGIHLVILQFSLNRRFISWLALFFWLASVVGIFLFSIESFAHVVGIGTIWFFK